MTDISAIENLVESRKQDVLLMKIILFVMKNHLPVKEKKFYLVDDSDKYLIVEDQGLWRNLLDYSQRIAIRIFHIKNSSNSEISIELNREYIKSGVDLNYELLSLINEPFKSKPRRIIIKNIQQ